MPISRDLYFFTNGDPQGEAYGYISYVLSDAMDQDRSETPATFPPTSPPRTTQRGVMRDERQRAAGGRRL